MSCHGVPSSPITVKLSIPVGSYKWARRASLGVVATSHSLSHSTELATPEGTYMKGGGRWGGGREGRPT